MSPGQPIVGQLGGEGEGQAPQGFPNHGVGCHASTAQPEMVPQPSHTQGWVMLGRPGGAHRDPHTHHLWSTALGAWGPWCWGTWHQLRTSVLSTSMSFCASSTESFLLVGHERAFIPSPPRVRLMFNRTLYCCLALGLSVALARLGAWHNQGVRKVAA